MNSWKKLRGVAEANLREVVAAVGNPVEDMWTGVSSFHSQTYALSAVAGFGTGGAAGDELAAVTGEFTWVADGVRFRCDIARGDGPIEADLPDSTFIGEESPEMFEWAQDCLDRFHRLCLTHIELIKRMLVEGPDYDSS